MRKPRTGNSHVPMLTLSDHAELYIRLWTWNCRGIMWRNRFQRTDPYTRFLVGCLNPRLQGTSVGVVSPEPWEIGVGSPRFTLLQLEMVPQAAGVINPSCSDHINLFVRFKPWNCWALCSRIDLGPTTLHTLTTRDADIWCQNCSVRSVSRAPITATFPSGSSHEIVGVMFTNRCWPTIFHSFIAQDVDGWCHKCVVWSTPHAPITANFRPVPAVKLVETMFRNSCWPNTFHNTIAQNVDGWYQKCVVWSTPHSLIAGTQRKPFHPFRSCY